MIYSIVPIAQILSSETEGAETTESERALYMGEEVFVTRSESGQYSIARLLSTNPQSYLKAELFPGAAADIRRIEFI